MPVDIIKKVFILNSSRSPSRRRRDKFTEWPEEIPAFLFLELTYHFNSLY